MKFQEWWCQIRTSGSRDSIGKTNFLKTLEIDCPRSIYTRMTTIHKCTEVYSISVCPIPAFHHPPVSAAVSEVKSSAVNTQTGNLLAPRAGRVVCIASKTPLQRSCRYYANQDVHVCVCALYPWAISPVPSLEVQWEPLFIGLICISTKSKFGHFTSVFPCRTFVQNNQ